MKGGLALINKLTLMVIGFLIVRYLYENLTPSEVSVWFIITGSGVLLGLLDYGLGNSFLNSISKISSKVEEKKLLASYQRRLIIRFFYGLSVLLIIITIWSSFGDDIVTRTLDSASLTVIYIVMAINVYFSFYYKVACALSKQNIPHVIGILFPILLTALIGNLSLSLFWFCLLYPVLYGVQNLAAFIVLYGDGLLYYRTKQSVAVVLDKDSRYFMYISICNILSYVFDKYVLSVFYDVNSVNSYSVAEKMALPLLLVQTLVLQYWRTMSKRKIKSKTDAETLLVSAVVFYCLIIMIMHNPIFEFWIGGDVPPDLSSWVYAMLIFRGFMAVVDIKLPRVYREQGVEKVLFMYMVYTSIVIVSKIFVVIYDLNYLLVLVVSAVYAYFIFLRNFDVKEP